MISWITKSVKHKVILVLIIFSIVPILLFGVTTNLVTTNIIDKKLNYVTNQSIDKLSLYISNEFRTLIDLAFYCSQNDYIGNVLETSPENSQEIEEIHYSILSQINKSGIMNRFSYLLSYMIITQDGYIYTNYASPFSDNYKNAYEKIKTKSWYKALCDSYSPKSWVGTDSNYLFPEGWKQIYVANNIFHNLDNIGIIVVGLDECYLTKHLDNVKFSNKSSIYCLDSKGNCLVEGEDNYYPFEKLPISVVQSMLKNTGTQEYTNVLGKTQMIIQKNLNIAGNDDPMKIVMITPVEDIRKEIKYINYITFILIIISIIVIIILIYLVNKDIINPIIQLSVLMREVKQGNLEVKAKKVHNDEIGLLEEGFNVMVSNLKKNIEDIKKEEIIKRELEIKMLQSQIKPHFIKNTLETIRWMAEIKKAEGVSRAIVSFKKLLDYNTNDTEIMTTVRNELNYLDEYIYLQQLHFQNKFFTTLDIDEGIKDYKILKLSLQPIVENSIYHGLSGKVNQGSLVIKGYKEDNKLVFLIIDDGVGMDKDTHDNCMASTGKGLSGIGLSNVQQRIQKSFGEEYGISIESEKCVGTKVRLVLPIIDPLAGRDVEDEGFNS